MSATDKLAEIQRLHGRYRMLTGLIVPLDMHREYVWLEFLRRGMTEQDLATVVRHIRRGVADGSRNRGALRFHNLIGQIDYFEEELAEAAAAGRRKSEVRSPKSEVLRATGRDSEAQSPRSNVQSLGIVAASVSSDPVKVAAALEELRKLKGSL